MARVNGIIGGDAKKFYYANDHEGNGMIVTDENGNKVVERDFTPFGQRIDQEGHEGKFPDETEDGFTGKDWDEDIGLYYFNARWYDPEVGRFISEDSVADDPNLYGYCGQNPVNMTDPTGHAGLPVFKSPAALMGAMLSAVALLSEDPNMGMFASAFSLFITIDTAIQNAKKAKDIAKTAYSGAAIGAVVGTSVSSDTKTESQGGQEDGATDTTRKETATEDAITEGETTTETTPADVTDMTTTPETPATNNSSPVISDESKDKLKKLAQVDHTVKKILDEMNGPIGVKLTLSEGIITFSTGNGLQITIEVLDDVEITKGTITVKFGPDGKISSISDIRGNKISLLDKRMVKLAIALAQPTEISFGRNSEFSLKNELLGEMSWNGRPTIYSTTIMHKPTGQAIKVSVGLDVDLRPPAPQKAPAGGGIPFPLPPIMPIPLPI